MSGDPPVKNLIIFSLDVSNGAQSLGEVVWGEGVNACFSYIHMYLYA